MKSSAWKYNTYSQKNYKNRNNTFYQYDFKGNLVLKESYKEHCNLTEKQTIDYEYDKEGNLFYKKFTLDVYYNTESNISVNTVEHQYIYETIYSNDNLLLESICSLLSPAHNINMPLPFTKKDKEEYFRERFSYNKGLLIKKEYINPVSILKYTSFFEYNLDNKRRENSIGR